MDGRMTGIYKVGNKYKTVIYYNKKEYYLGTYENIEDAKEMRKDAEYMRERDFESWYNKVFSMSYRVPLIIDEYLRGFEYKLNEDAYLEEVNKCLENKYMRDIWTWNNIIVAGWCRYEICLKYNLEFHKQKINFNSRDEVILWILRNEYQRSLFDKEAQWYYREKIYDLENKLYYSDFCKPKEQANFNLTHLRGICNLYLDKISEIYRLNKKDYLMQLVKQDMLIHPEIMEKLESEEENIYAAI